MRGPLIALGGEPGARVAASQPAATWAMPVDPALKRRGWEIHASQAGYVRRAWKVPPSVLYLFFDEEHFYRPAEEGR